MVPWWAAIGLAVLALAAAASIILSAVAIFRLTARVNMVEQENCALYAQLHLTLPPRC